MEEKEKTTVNSSFAGLEIKQDRDTGKATHFTTGSVVVDSDGKRIVLEEPIDIEPHPPANDMHIQRSLRSSEQGKRPKKIKSMIMKEFDHEPLN